MDYSVNLEKYRANIKQYWTGRKCEKHPAVDLYNFGEGDVCGECQIEEDNHRLADNILWWQREGKLEKTAGKQ